MYRKKMLCFMMALMMAGTAMTGCSGNSGKTETKAQAAGETKEEAQSQASAPEEPQKVVEFRIASAYDTSTTMLQATQKFVDTIAEKSGGTLKGTIYAAGVMGGEKENVEAIKMGELEMSVLGTYPIVNLMPEYSFFDAPFVFRDRDHYFNVWNSEIGDKVRESFEKDHHIRTLGIMGRGYRHITSNNPINSAADLKGIKMRMGQSTPFIDSFTEIGAVVVPIALPELFTSLQMGVVSASEGPFDQIDSYKLYEVQDHLAITGHLYATSMWLMNSDFYNKLSDEQKKIIDESAREALEYGTQLSDEAEEALLKKLEGDGMKVTHPDYHEFMEKARPAIDKLFEKDWTVTTAKEIDQY